MSIKSIFRCSSLVRGLKFPSLQFSPTPSYYKNDEYARLISRLERNLIPMTANKVLEEILERVLTPDQAEFLSVFPIGFVHISEIVRIYEKEGYENKELFDIIDVLEELGFILEVELFNNEFFYFPEFIVGWYEFFWMKDRSQQFDTKILGKLFDEYMYDTFIPSIPIDPKNNMTRPARSLVYEDVVPEPVEVLDFETARGVVENAEAVSVQHCPCRRQYYELNPELENPYPSETCLAFDQHAQAAGKVGLGRMITSEEALDILQDCRDHGLGCLSDNSKNPTFICNCAKDSCLVYNGFHKSGVKYMMNKSRFQPRLDKEKCVSCKTCIERCPLELYSYDNEGKEIVFDFELCWGCGICSHFCPEGALEMVENISVEEYADGISENYIEFVIRFLAQNERIHDVVCFDQQSSCHQRMRPFVKKFEKSKFGKKVIVGVIKHGVEHYKKHGMKHIKIGKHCHNEQRKYLDDTGAVYERFWEKCMEDECCSSGWDCDDHEKE